MEFTVCFKSDLSTIEFRSEGRIVDPMFVLDALSLGIATVKREDEYVQVNFKQSDELPTPITTETKLVSRTYKIYIPIKGDADLSQNTVLGRVVIKGDS